MFVSIIYLRLMLPRGFLLALVESIRRVFVLNMGLQNTIALFRCSRYSATRVGLPVDYVLSQC